MKSLIKYLKGYGKESILGPLFKLLEASFELLIPLVMADIIDVGIRNNDISRIWKMGAVMILLGVVGWVSSITAQYFAAKAAVGFGTALRKDLFVHINSLSYSELDKIGTSTLITRITTDINQVQNSVNMVLRLFLRSPFIVFGAMVMAFAINVKAAFIFVITIIALSVVIFGIMLLTLPYYGKVQKQLDNVLKYVRENLEGVRVIRAFNRQVDETKEFNEKNERLKKMQIFVGNISSLLNPITYVIINLAIVLVIRTGAAQVNNGFISQGQVIALVNYMSQILVELVKLAGLIITLTKSLACADRISDVLAQKSSMEDGKGAFQGGGRAPKVIFEKVNFKYRNEKGNVLENLSFRVEKGETVGVIGGTGSGKTSVINLIPRFYDATEGAVMIDGVDVKKYPVMKLRDKIGIVPQRAVLFSGTIRENMKWGKKEATDAEINKALEIAQAKEIVDNKEKGLDTMILQNGKNLSGGQRQRLTIARALVKEPEILILDDSASALDFATDARLRSAISQMEDQITVFIVSQRVHSVMNADKIIVLDDGHIVGYGQHRQLLEESDVYREICLSQLSEEEVYSK